MFDACVQNSGESWREPFPTSQQVYALASLFSTVTFNAESEVGKKKMAMFKSKWN